MKYSEEGDKDERMILIKLTKEQQEAKAEKEMYDLMFANFTNIFQDSHPTIAASIKNVTTCIENAGLVEKLKDISLGASRLGHSSLQERNNYCMDNKNIVSFVYRCINKASTPENEKFIDALHLTATFVVDLFCATSDKNVAKIAEASELPLKELLTLEEYLPFSKIDFLIKNEIIPTEMNYCLPVRASEAFEMAVIKTRSIPFEFHSRMTVGMQLAITIQGKFPFKTLEECQKEY
uniref:Uncharacterized protein n=1 Tax=Panagrolaimus davidi TaxID=227884 RepID=A0A914QWG0_9BILA